MCAQMHTNKRVCGTHTQTHLQKPEEELDVLISHFAPYSLRQSLSPDLALLASCSILPLFSYNTGATRHVPARRCAAPFRALRQAVESDFRSLHLHIAASLTQGALFPPLLGVLFQHNKLHQDEDIYSGIRKLHSPLNLKQH